MNICVLHSDHSYIHIYIYIYIYIHINISYTCLHFPANSSHGWNLSLSHDFPPEMNTFFGGFSSHVAYRAGDLQKRPGKIHKIQQLQDGIHRCPFPIGWLINRGG